MLITRPVEFLWPSEGSHRVRLDPANGKRCVEPRSQQPTVLRLLAVTGSLLKAHGGSCSSPITLSSDIPLTASGALSPPGRKIHRPAIREGETLRCARSRDAYRRTKQSHPNGIAACRFRTLNRPQLSQRIRQLFLRF